MELHLDQSLMWFPHLTAKQFATPANAWPSTLRVNWTSWYLSWIREDDSFCSFYQWHFIIELRKSADASEQSSDEVDEGTKDESSSEADIIIDEGGKDTAGNTDIEGDGAEKVDGIDGLVKVLRRHVSHGRVAHPEGVGGKVQEADGGQDQPPSLVHPVAAIITTLLQIITTHVWLKPCPVSIDIVVWHYTDTNLILILLTFVCTWSQSNSYS